MEASFQIVPEFGADVGNLNGNHKMKIWVTGANGFLGKRLFFSSEAEKHEIISFSRGKIDKSIGRKLVTIDLVSSEVSQKIKNTIHRYGQPDVIIHLASKKPGNNIYCDYVKDNILSTANLLDSILCSPPKRIIYTSTTSVYGKPLAQPVREDCQANPTHPYGITKLAAEQLVRSFHPKSEVVVLRLPTFYGTGQADSFIDGLARIALRNDTIDLFDRGVTVRDALHVSDVVNAIWSSVFAPLPATEICLNLGCGEEITTLQYVNALLKSLNSSSQIVLSDKKQKFLYSMYADISAAKSIISFSPKSLDEAMHEYANEIRT